MIQEMDDAGGSSYQNFALKILKKAKQQN